MTIKGVSLKLFIAILKSEPYYYYYTLFISPFTIKLKSWRITRAWVKFTCNGHIQIIDASLILISVKFQVYITNTTQLLIRDKNIRKR